jgi:hypothetical protein
MQWAGRAVPKLVGITVIINETIFWSSKGKINRDSRPVLQIAMRAKCIATSVQCRMEESRRKVLDDLSVDLLGAESAR